jgi:hypothetical protein
MPDEGGASAAVVAIPDSFGDGRRGGVSNGSATDGAIVAGDGGRADGVSSTGIDTLTVVLTSIVVARVRAAARDQSRETSVIKFKV